MSNNKKKVIPTNRQDTSQMDELKTEINNLPKDNPKACEGLIRELSKKISEVNNESVKERLHFDLKAVSCLGLNSELKKMVEDNGLNMEAIQLVLKYLTTKEQLGEYFFTHPNEDSESAGLDAVRRRLCPKLEVLGGLLAKGIDVTKPWVQKLVNAAPSLQTLSRISVAELKELCKGENQGEREVVTRLVKDAGSRSRQRAAAQDLQEFRGKEGGGKAIDHEKLKKAKALMKEAKKLATDQADEAKKAVNGKLAEITKTLQLPRDWNKDIGPEPGQLLQKLDGIIEKFKGVGEVGEPYQSEMEVVRKASGGRALCGIYYSEYVPPVTAEVPIIVMPDTLILSSPNNSQQVRYMQFSKSQAAADYVQSVKSSSSNIGVGIAGFYELAVGEFSGSKATRSDREKTTSEKMQTNSASVVQYIWIATKTFTIDQERLKLSASAIKMASTTVKDADTARLFMQRYGSHFPAGVHTLGGVLFRIVDAESESTKATTILAAKAANQLQGQISGGVLAGLGGIGVSISGEKNSSNGTVEGHDEKTDDVFYTFSSQAMGPATTNPATFNKMLANNSTWAIIDRGSPTAYIPIWEMIRDIDVVFEEAAKHLENTWRNDEEERMNDMPEIALDIITAPEREKVYADSGTRAKKGICVFQATLDKIPDDYYIIGQVAVAQTESVDVPKSSIILVKPLLPNLIKPPLDYLSKWKDVGSGGEMDCEFWRIVAPEGYAALGDVVTNNYSKPSDAFTNKFACIRKDLLVKGTINHIEQWNDRGSGAKQDGSVWQVDGPGLAGLFKVQSGYQKPVIQVFVLPAKVVQEK